MLDILGVTQGALALGGAIFGGNGDERVHKPQRGYGGELRRFEEYLGIRALPKKMGGAGGPATRALTGAEMALFQSGAWRQGASGALSAIGPTTGGYTGPTLADIGVSPAVVQPTVYRAPTAMATMADATSIPGAIARYVGQKAGEAIVRRITPPVGARRGGGEMHPGVVGEEFVTTGGYPVGTNMEDLMEQTYTPDLWARRLSRGIAVLAGPLKRGYSVPLVAHDSSIQGRVRATGGAIPRKCIILYGGAFSEVEKADQIQYMLKGFQRRCFCEVVDEMGGDAFPVVGIAMCPPKRRRRGGIHVSGKALQVARSTAKKLNRLVKVQKDLKKLASRGR